MAKLVSYERGETVYTLKLTEREVETLVAVLSCTPYEKLPADKNRLYMFLVKDVLEVVD